MDKNEFRVLIKHCFLIKKNTVEAQAWLNELYHGSAPPYSTIKYWYAKFRRGEMSTEDAERSGRPKEAVTVENIEKVHQLILNDRNVKLTEIANTLQISSERVHHIIHEHLDMKSFAPTKK